MESSMNKDKGARGAVRAALTRMKVEMSDAVENAEIQVVKEVLAKLRLKEEKLKEYDRRIEAQVKEEEIEEEINRVMEYEDYITEWKSRLETIIAESEKSQASSAIGRNNDEVDEGDSRDLSRVSTGGVTSTRFVRLPKLEIAKFAGDITKWPAFWGSFESTIHENESLSKVDKFNYLRALVMGPALACIEALPVNSKSYDVAVGKLGKRFGQKDQIINSLLNSFSKIGPPKNEVSGLRRFYDECDSRIEGLRTQGVDPTGYGGLLCPTLIRLVPRELQVHWARSRKGSVINDLKEFMKFLLEEIEAREGLQALNEDVKRESRYVEERDKRVSASTAALNVTSEGVNPYAVGARALRNRVECYICGGMHFARNCTVKGGKERVEKLKQRNRCFNCLREGHVSRTCPRPRARCPSCYGRHHALLCFSPLEGGARHTALAAMATESNSENSSLKAQVNETASVSANQVTSSEKEIVLLKSAVVWVVGEGGEAKIRILVDGGSQRSFITKRLCRKLKGEVTGKEWLSVHRFNEKEARPEEYEKVRVQLHDVNRENSMEIVAYATEEVCATYRVVPGQVIQNSMKKLGLRIADEWEGANSMPIDILIGADFYWSVITGKVVKLSNELAAIESIFGWMIQGKSDQPENGHVECMSVTVLHAVGSLEQKTLSREIEKFWSLESMGIENESKRDNGSVLPLEEEFRRNIRKKNERYEVTLPWNENKERLSRNREEALRRFFTNIRRMSKQEGRLKRYHEAMMSYVNNQHAEVVGGEQNKDGILHYLPHQAVVRESHDTTDWRVVFDASSGQVSLNDCLYPGPHLNPDILDVLVRFRRNTVAITADIEKAFLQVELREEDRDAVRFFWLSPGWRWGDPLIPVEYKMKRVLFGLNCGPYLLAATLRYHFAKEREEFPETVGAIERDIYVDDVVKSVETVEAGTKLYVESKQLLKKAGFNLRKWATNSPELREFIEGHAGGSQHAVRPENELIKVLGMRWDQITDELKYNSEELVGILREKPDTKRTVLRAMARVFDPLGLIAPFVVRLKILFQDLWIAGKGWDEPLTEENGKKWNLWREELQFVPMIAIPRCLVTKKNREVIRRELHAFSDASERAYGCAVYLVEGDREGCHSSVLIAGKSRIAPIRKMTIPQLELMGALLSTRLTKSLREALGEQLKTTYWTDSMIVLYWIKGCGTQYKPFVEGKVREIRNSAKEDEWRFVNSKENPADKVTRGLNAKVLVKDKTWWMGPAWLLEKPDAESESLERGIDYTEAVENAEQEFAGVAALLTTDTRVGSEVEVMWEATRYSSWKKLVRVVAWVLRFAKRCRRGSIIKGALTSEELSEAVRTILAREQQVMFPTEYGDLESGQQVRKNSRLWKLDPQMGGDGMIRIGGRLQFAELKWETKHPVVLDGDCWITQLLIRDAHERMMHGGVSETITELRENYWVIRARSKVSKEIRKCPRCMRRRAKPVTVVEAPLPVERVCEAQPFEIVGIDYAGPLYAMQQRVQVKTYVLLITCAVTRAVHLELVSSMSAEDFLMAFRRFLARRGVCRLVWSDNAKSFKRAEKDLNLWYEMISGEKIKQFVTERGIKWDFIVDRAPWWGGIWERLVRSVKEKLKVVCGREMLKVEELQTILIEVEGILNSRPLGYVKEDQEILTPSHLVIGKRLTAVPPSSKSSEKLGGEVDVGKRWRNRLRIVNRFWRLWRTDYLLALRTAHERRNVGIYPTLKNGQLVLVDDERNPRHLWKLCRVHDVITGRDGKVRACVLQAPDKKLLKRPVQLIYPLEL